MNKLFLAAIAATGLATALAAPANAGAHAPVRIASCTVTPVYKPAFFGDNDGPGSSPRATVWISFRDRSENTATAVTFLVKGRTGVEKITAHGQFSQGVLIRKTLGPFSGLRGDDTCSLYSAQFANGVAWNEQQQG
jgi:hypothetical protein